MIREEEFIINGITFIKRYSDEGFYILQNETGVKYGEAIDIITTPYTYTETDELIPVEQEEQEEEQIETEEEL